jgi:carbonyl reductase 1
MSVRILVTGGNSGIGLALCKQLAARGCRVFMGTRSKERGAAALSSIADALGADVAARIEPIQLDVADDASVQAAAASLRSSNVVLYALVNNAGIGLNSGPGHVETLLNTNFVGPKRCSEAFLDVIDPDAGRIVNVSSGSASMWLRGQSAEIKQIFTSADTSWELLAATVQRESGSASMGGYGLSKAGLTAYTIQQAKKYPNLVCTSLSPGFIQTKMTAGFGARLTPEQGTVSLLKCLFEDVVSGSYYGSDGLRSPLTVTRDPGTPEYGGEDDPDASRYNN